MAFMICQVIKAHAIDSICTISSFPQNLFHIQYPLKLCGWKYENVVLQSKTVMAKWDRKVSKSLQSSTKVYYKLHQVLHSVADCYYKMRDLECESYYKVRRNTADVDMYFNILHKVGPGALKIALVKREHKKIPKEVYMYLTVFVW